MPAQYVVALLVLFHAASAFAVPATDADIAGIRLAMEERLKDADSAKFKDVKIATDNSVCGKVNAKNSYGAYSGYDSFLGVKLSSGKFYIVGVGEASGDVCANKQFE